MQELDESPSSTSVAFARSARRVRRKPGTLVPLVLGRVLSAPMLVLFAGLIGLALLEPIVVFLVPAQPARIVRLWRDISAHRPAVYLVEYKFDQSGFTGRDQLLPEEFQKFHLGQLLKAHAVHLETLGYSALDRSLIAYGRYRVILWLGALFAATMGWVIFHSIWLVPWQTWWLMHHGQKTYGAIVEKRAVHVRRLHCSFTLTYQFKAMGKLQARQIRISSQRYDTAQVKDLVTILFDPSRPHRSVIYDYCDFVAS